ncbi:putative Chase2 sensor protein [Calothrix parasitica NIES-267]|uniref:Putative Chase2 sensor protein n=1 Tax=Calothrix parasitica NIES-267 TaxID=1973488 RepID=A0A1Z4LK57_9CYAN|nr:putative Chase2 sensor protein [Calothrix parasitica NIES-267]
MSNFNLKIQLIEKTCLFELAWGDGQQLNATLTYPQTIANSYNEWQQCYLKFYKNSFRGKVADIGTIAPPPIDWRAKLVEAETKFLSEFRHWLRSAELYQIRSIITNTNKTDSNESKTNASVIKIQNVEVFLTCNSLELERLPWEAWNIGSEFAVNSDIRIVRKPININEPNTIPIRHRKVRILAILGDDTGLGFAEEKKVLNSLKKVVDVKFIGWEPGKDINQLKQEIVDNLSDKIGWDILFFAGHSNEKSLTGGEIVIAPNTALFLNEIQTPLTIAKENGLQVAIFNSCSGLSIANKLIDLGFSQVAIMREPIHNQVAIEFFMQFSQALAEYKDVHQSLLEASEYLHKKNYNYPSSYLIPSLFRHPAANLFRIEPSGFKIIFKRLKPTRTEAIAISALSLISLLHPVQDLLLNQRLLLQAIYRQTTNQIAEQKKPEVVLLQIDNQSIQKSPIPIPDPRPMNREYIALLINKLTESNANIIGIDYLLGRNHGKNNEILAKSISNAIEKSDNPTYFVFPITFDKRGQKLETLSKIADSNSVLHGEIKTIDGYIPVLPVFDEDSEIKPFAYLLSLTRQLQSLPNPPKPKLNSQKNLEQNIYSYLQKTNNNQNTISELPRNRTKKLTALSYWLNQMWLHPIMDYSIPPSQVYRSIAAWELLENSNSKYNFENQIVIIAPGGYGEAGLSQNGQDNHKLPPAFAYWNKLENPANNTTVMIGSEVHAYLVHHLLNNRIVIPIPDIWMIFAAIFLGKVSSLYIHFDNSNGKLWLLGFGLLTITYGIVSLQIYISKLGLLLPWFLPSITFLFYVTSNLSKYKNE